MSTLGLTATGAALEAIDRHLPALLQDRVASRLGAQDADLWGAPARDEAAKRLGWIDLFEDSRALVPHIAQLTRELRAEGVDRVVLAGMGGSSLAPEVIAATAGVELEVLDSTDPLQVSRALERDLERTVLVVSSKSGSTVETDSQRRVVEAAFRDAGIDPRTRLVAVTDPGSPLHAACESAGWRAVFTADPTVGGRFSALTAFGLVPTGLAGVDVAALLDDAEAVLDLLIADDEDNPGLQLGAGGDEGGEGVEGVLHLVPAQPDQVRRRVRGRMRVGSLAGGGDQHVHACPAAQGGADQAGGGEGLVVRMGHGHEQQRLRVPDGQAQLRQIADAALGPGRLGRAVVGVGEAHHVQPPSVSPVRSAAPSRASSRCPWCWRR